MSIEEYRANINRLIDEMSGELALNGSHEHASVILERMFARAKNSVRILSRTLDPRIYAVPETLEACRRFLGNTERECKVIVEEFPSNSHGFLSLGREYQNFQVKQVPDGLKKPVAINFALMDRSGFRFEKDQTETTAIAAFGEKDLTNSLDKVFDRLWDKSVAAPAMEAA